MGGLIIGVGPRARRSNLPPGVQPGLAAWALCQKKGYPRARRCASPVPPAGGTLRAGTPPPPPWGKTP